MNKIYKSEFSDIFDVVIFETFEILAKTAQIEYSIIYHKWYYK